MGNGGAKTKTFEYTVIFEEAGKDGSYAYTKSDGATSTPGTIKSGESFTLKDGEKLEIVGLPKDLKYTVTQKDYTTDEYVTLPIEQHYTGIMEGKDEAAPFTNVRVIEGGLIISNKVEGKDNDKTKPFSTRSPSQARERTNPTLMRSRTAAQERSRAEIPSSLPTVRRSLSKIFRRISSIR